MVHADTGGYKPQNWMTPPCVVEESDDYIEVRKVKAEDKLEIRVVEVLSDVTHDMGEAAALEKDGDEKRPPGAAGRPGPLVRRGLPARAPRVADRHRPGRPDVPRRRRRLDRGRDQARRHDRRGRAAHALPRAHPPGSRARASAAASWPRRRSSRRPRCWPSRAGSAGSRSTSPCCAASASRTSCSLRHDVRVPSPKVGDQAPDFTLPGTAGGFTLSAQRGKRVLLLFYPGDDTPVCTRQFCSYRDNSADMESLDAVLVGISARTRRSPTSRSRRSTASTSRCSPTRTARSRRPTAPGAPSSAPGARSSRSTSRASSATATCTASGSTTRTSTSSGPRWRRSRPPRPPAAPH